MSYGKVNVVMIVGKRGNGKTTALNHLTAALDKIREYLVGLDFTLIYCLPVAAPDDDVDPKDEIIINNLHNCLGKTIWKKSLILLTFSDKTLETFSEDSKYIRWLQTCSKNFGHVLQSKIVNCPEVKTIFEYRSGLERQETSLDGIVALPVARAPTNVKIMPGIHLQDGRWTSAVIRELLRKLTPPDVPIEFSAFTESDREHISGMIKGAIRIGLVSRPSTPYMEPKSDRDKKIIRLLQLIETQNTQ